MNTWRPLGNRDVELVPWLRYLTPDEKQIAVAGLSCATAARKARIVQAGEPSAWWYGVLQGMLKVGGRGGDGASFTFSAIPAGGWFGEGTMLEGGVYRYEVEALQSSLIARLDSVRFHQLAQASIGFSRFLVEQINERLGQLIAARAIERMESPEERLAHGLHWLSHPRLFPGVGASIAISQEELAMLVDISRRRVHEGLVALERRGLVRLAYGSVELLDRDGLVADPGAVLRPQEDERSGKTGSSTADDSRFRRRNVQPGELDMVHWLPLLSSEHQAIARAALNVLEVPAGAQISRPNVPATRWCGTLSGLLKMSSDYPDGRSVTYAGLPPSAWFGEGTVLKRERSRSTVEALRDSEVAALRATEFLWLAENSLQFSAFLLDHLKARLSQFMALRETARSPSLEMRVARSLALTLHPVLCPRVGPSLMFSQHELALLVGASRSRVSGALQALQRRGAVRIGYGGVSVQDVAVLRELAQLPPP